MWVVVFGTKESADEVVDEISDVVEMTRRLTAACSPSRTKRGGGLGSHMQALSAEAAAKARARRAEATRESLAEICEKP